MSRASLRLAGLALAALLLASSAEGAREGREPATGAGEGPLTVGVILDLTGPGAALGEAERVGVRLAEAEIAERGGVRGRPLRVAILDSGTSGAGSQRAVRQAIERERAVVLIGASTTAPTLALVDAALRAEVPLLALAGSRRAGEPAAGRRWIFQVPPGDGLAAGVIARDLARRGLRRVAWIEAAGPIGANGWAAFEPAARRERLSVVARERIAEGEAEPAGLIGRALGARPQALVCWAIPPLAGVVAQVLHDLAPGLPHYQSHAAATATFLPLAGAAAAGVRTPYGKLAAAEALPETDPQRPLLLGFLRSLRARSVAQPSAFAGYGYDALRLAAAALGRALELEGSSAPSLARRRYDVREALEATRDAVGVTGIFSYGSPDHAGLDERSIVLLEAVVPPGAQAGEWRLVR